MLHQAASGQFSHLACAHQQHRSSLQRAEDFARQVDGHRGDGDRGDADAGLVAHLASHGKCALHERVEIVVDAADRSRQGVRLFHLAKDLGLTDDERIQTRSDAEHVANDFRCTVFIRIWMESVLIDGEVILNEFEQIGLRRLLIGEELDTVAGRENHRFPDARHAEQRQGCFFQACRWNGEPLPHLQGSRFVIHADQDEVHGAGNLWTVLNWLATHTVSAMRNTSEER